MLPPISREVNAHLCGDVGDRRRARPYALAPAGFRPTAVSGGADDGNEPALGVDLS